ncbi:putative transcription factor C2H2 family [Helianthus anomalus]
MRTLLQEEDSDKLLRSPATSSPFDSSLVLTVLVLLTVLFFMAFFSLYIRRFSSVTSSGDENSVSGAGNSPPRLHKRGGVDVSTVQSLPIVLYGGDLKTWSECSICLTEFEEKETVKVIPYCRHGFHPVCIETWLSSHGSCPMCRSTQLFPAVDEVRTGTG